MMRARRPHDIDDLARLLTELRIEVAALGASLEGLDRLTDEKFVKYAAMLNGQAEKVALALASADKAVTKAEVATERRFDGVNEFRKTLADQTATFIARVEVDQRISALTEKITEGLAANDAKIQLNTDRINITEGRSTGLSDGTKLLIGLAGLLFTAISLYLALRK